MPSNETATRLPRLERARIAQARAEAGATAVAPPVARLLVAMFALAIASPSAVQMILNPGFFRMPPAWSAAAGSAPMPGAVVDGVRTVNRELLARARGFENRVAEDSVLGQRLRPVVQEVLTGWLGAGTSQVEIGIDGWLFYRPDLDHVTGPGFLSAKVLARRAGEGDTLSAARQPDPRPALVSLNDQLARRGARLIVLPTPVKPSVDPMQIGFGRFYSEPIMNPSYRRYVRYLREAGVAVFDVSGILSAMRREGRAPLYLATDTHWRPETMQRIAVELAAFIERQGWLSEPVGGHRSRPIRVTNEGDTARLLELGPSQNLYPAETVTTRRIETVQGEAWAPDRSAEVLLLGDSFTNVYSLPSLDWGASAGFAEQLSFALGRSVDRISQNNDGALAPRRLLAMEAARDAGRLMGTRVVVYQFATRELSQGDWRSVGLGSESTRGEGVDAFWVPDVDSIATVEATVAATGAIPGPGSVPYRDHIVAVHITEIDLLAGQDAGMAPGAVVYLRSMIDNELTEAAGYRPGDRVLLRLESWANIATELDGISRGDLADPSLLLAVPWWGVPVDVQP